MGIKIFALAWASFAVGFSLCNVIYVFFSPYSKRNNRNDETSKADEQRKDGDDL